MANKAYTFLRNHGYTVYRSGLRHHHTLSYVLLQLFRGARVVDDRANYFGFRGSRSSAWMLLEVIALLPALLTRVVIPSIFRDVLLCDRFLPELIVSTAVIAGKMNETLTKMLLGLEPRNSLAIYMTTNEQTA